MDCRLITKKSRGSLTYLPGRRGTGCSSPPDHDPMVQIKGVWRSNRVRPKQIRRTGGKRVDGGGAGRRETFPAAAPHRRGSNPVFQGQNQPGFGLGLAYTTCVIYLWPKLGSGRTGAVGSTAAAGLCGGAHRSASVPVPGWPTGSRV